MEIMGIRIPTLISENSAARCDACRKNIDGVPFRVSILDIIATEIAPSFGEPSPINPGPFQFCTDRSCPDRWIAARGWLRCTKSSVREVMRPVHLQVGERATIGLCDGIHRDDHEFVAP